MQSQTTAESVIDSFVAWLQLGIEKSDDGWRELRTSGELDVKSCVPLIQALISNRRWMMSVRIKFVSLLKNPSLFGNLESSLHQELARHAVDFLHEIRYVLIFETLCRRSFKSSFQTNPRLPRAKLYSSANYLVES